MKIIILGRLKSVMENVLEVFKTGGFDVIGVYDDDEAYQHLLSGQFNIIIIGGAVGKGTREKIFVIATDKKIKVIEVEKGDKIAEEYYPDVIFPLLS